MSDEKGINSQVTSTTIAAYKKRRYSKSIDCSPAVPCRRAGQDLNIGRMCRQTAVCRLRKSNLKYHSDAKIYDFNNETAARGRLFLLRNYYLRLRLSLHFTAYPAPLRKKPVKSSKTGGFVHISNNIILLCVCFVKSAEHSQKVLPPPCENRI